MISPVGGNGILMAIQDAVAAANDLIPALRRPDPVAEDALVAIQADRQGAITRVQADQAKVENQALRAREAGRALIPAAPRSSPLSRGSALAVPAATRTGRGHRSWISRC